KLVAFGLGAGASRDRPPPTPRAETWSPHGTSPPARRAHPVAVLSHHRARVPDHARRPGRGHTPRRPPSRHHAVPAAQRRAPDAGAVVLRRLDGAVRPAAVPPSPHLVPRGRGRDLPRPRLRRRRRGYRPVRPAHALAPPRRTRVDEGEGHDLPRSRRPVRARPPRLPRPPPAPRAR